MRELPCYIWNTPASEIRDSDGHATYLNSPRAGGDYAITGTAVVTIKHLNNRERALLTTRLCNQRGAGIECPKVTSDTVSDVKSLRPLSTKDRLDRILLYFNDHFRIGEVLVMFPGEFTKADPHASMLAAVSESETKPELDALMRLLENMGLISDETSTLGRYNFTPTANGWLRIDELVERLPVSSQAFVAMWFHQSMDAAYKNGIEPAIRECGYRAMRIDNHEHINKIDDQIIAEIRRSKFLIADFTCEKEKVRGGVYFEAGFAMGLGIPVIRTCSSASINDLHFDTRQYNHIVWDTPETLHELLKARVGAVIGDGPLLGR